MVLEGYGLIGGIGKALILLVVLEGSDLIGGIGRL